MKRIIFLHPLELESSDSGSRLRPRKMLDTLINHGHEVFEIIGTRQNRLKKFEELKSAIQKGLKFDFLYVESLSRPTNSRIASLGGVKFFREEKLDYNIIQYCLDLKMPVGFFLRDLYWDFPTHGVSKSLKQFYFDRAIPYYGKKEMKFLKQNGIHVFSPSKAFSDYLEENWDMKSTPLSPGSIIANSEKRTLSAQNMKLFYVGGVIGHYDMKVFLDGVLNLSNVDFTLCVRKTERHVLEKYEGLQHIKIVHGVGDELKPYYAEAEVAVYPIRPEGYIKLAFGVKLIEYIGQGLPIIAFEGSQTAEFIERNNIGWIIKYSSESVETLLNHISNHPDEYSKKQQAVLDVQNQFTWDAVVNRLEDKLLNNPK